MPDIFDEVTAEPKADVFDEVSASSEPVWYKPSTWTYDTEGLKRDWSPEKLGELKSALIDPTVEVPKVTASDLSPLGPNREVLAGIERGAANLASGFSSPLGLATLGVGALPKIVGRGVAGLFAAHMAKSTPEAARQFGKAVGEGDLEKSIETGIDTAANIGLAGLAGAHAIAPKARIAPGVEESVVVPEPPKDVFDEVAPTPEIETKPKIPETTPPIPETKPVVAETKTPISEAPPTETPRNQLYREASEAKQVAQKEYPEIHKKIAESSGLSRKELDALSIPDPSEVSHPSEYENLASDLAANAPGGRLNRLYDQLAREGKSGRFIWGGTAENPKLGFEPDVKGETPDPVAAKKALSAVNSIRASLGAEPLPDFFKTEQTPLDVLNTASKAKIKAPEGATTLRGTDAKGRVAVQPIKAMEKGNPFKDADIVKMEAGTIDRTGKFKPIQGEIELKSVGAQSPSDVGELSKSNLAQLNDAINSLALDSKNTTPVKAFSLGEALSPIKERAHAALEGLKAAGKYLSKTLEGKPVWTKIKDILGDRHLELSESVVNAKKYVSETRKKIKDEKLQEAITNFVDTGGNPDLLRKGATEGPAKYRKGYERALNLSPEEKLLAEHAKSYFEARLDDAQKAGILEDGIENYIHRMYEAESPFKQKVMAELGSGLLSGNPSLAKQRVFEYDLEAEAAGLKPVKSFIQRIAAYDLALNKAIADRKAVKAMMNVKMPDGRPMIDVAGRGTKIIDPAGETSATMIDPGWKFSDPETPLKHRGDYQGVDHPALRKWKWATEDEGGKPVFVQGNVMVHPEAVGKLKALLEPSRIRANPVGRAALNVSSTVKQTMLDLSLFHYTQIGVHGFEHRSFRPVPEIDFTNPDVRGLIKGGMTVGETSGRGLFEEGLAGSSLTKYIPGLGPKIEALKSHLFESYIPRLKVNTGLHALERNRKTYPNLSESEVQHLTASQMNAAFGGLNYEMMGRSKTMQDVLRLSLLAPDFLEARARFAGQAGTWHGREQQKALVFGLVGMYVLARIMNKFIDDQYHMEPRNAFSVIYKGKAYGLRTVQGDIVHLITKPAQFMRNRLNPVTVRPLMELINERDSFGRKRDTKDKLIDIAKTPIPISLKGLTEGREQSLMESMLNAVGITEHRESASLEMFEKVEKWKKDNKIQTEPGEFVYDRDKDLYRKIRLAALYDDEDGVKKEMDAAVKNGIPRYKIVRHFSNSTTKPVTGSHANDKKFIASLSEDEKKTLAAAKEERKKIFQSVLKAR